MTGCMRILLATLALGLTGCSTFQRDWERAGQAGQRPAPGGIEGRWEGSWRSDKNGHNGALRCVVTRLTNDVYSARFHAKYKRLCNLTFGYTVRLETATANDRTTFRGEADLGWYAGGVYRYEGHSIATNFFSTYSCKYDYGTFQMTRPAEAPAPPSARTR